MNNDISEKILKLMRSPSYVPLSMPEIAIELGLDRSEFQAMKKTMGILLKDGRAAKVKGDKYAASSELDLVSGKIEFRQNGWAKLISSNGEFEVSPEDAFVALNGDTVLARIVRNSPRNENKRKGYYGKKSFGVGSAFGDFDKKYAKVIRILERSKSNVIGTLRRNYNFWHVVPDDPKFHYDILVPDPRNSSVVPEPSENDKVVVRLNEWTQRHISPSGEIVENLGKSHSPMSEYKAILSKYDLNPEFPQSVMEEVSKIPASVGPKDLEGRLDLRGEFTITIDPEDAKDFDDALSISKGKNGGIEIGVHIADVTHYVRPNSQIDREARRRGNSTYLVGTVIPMLPFELSNGICSLTEDNDRLVKSVFLTFDAGGDCIGVKFANSVIRSVKRLTYEQAYALLKENDNKKIRSMNPPAEYETKFAGKPMSELSDRQIRTLRIAVRQMWSLASVLRKKRMRKGAFDLEMPEIKIFCDADGYADRIERKEHNEAHQLVEEFMLAANEAIARELASHHQPFISRTHDAPENEKLMEFRDWILPFGIECGDLTSRNEVVRILSLISKSPQSYLMKTRFLRSMKRAVYRASCDGHYGLNKTYYAHFTSPIRRYADFTVHHNFECMMRDMRVDTFRKSSLKTISQSALSAIADHITRTENNSTEAERESVKIKLLEYFERAIGTGKTFEAIIVSLTSHGFFVELTESMAFGFVHVHTLKDDIYRLDDDGFALRGRRRGRIYAMGDKISLEIESVDRFKRQLDFHPSEGDVGGSFRTNRRGGNSRPNRNHGKFKKFRKGRK